MDSSQIKAARAAFEAWNGPHYLSRKNAPGDDMDGYQDSHVNKAWNAWKASAAITAATAQPEAEKLGWPKEIWLTPGCDPLPPFKECFEVSWCSEPIGSSDVRYVMAGAKAGA